MNAAGLLVKCLEEEGIEYIFGVPGEENADFMMALEQSDKIRFVLTRHEQGAAFMAEVYGRLTGNPAGALGTLGPGATNLITGVANANMDHAPMLVLTGQGSVRRLHKESHQVMDVVGMFEPVTKWATSIRHPDTIPEVVRKAVRLARTEKPGAVHIELPEDIARLPTAKAPMAPRRYRRAVIDDKVADRAFALLRNAESPVILAGNGCVDMDADYCLYTIGLGTRDRISAAIEQSDLVITLGFDMVEYHPALWNPGRDKRIIHADFLPAEIDEHYHPEVELIGDLAHTLWMLNERVAGAGDALRFDFSDQRRLRGEMWADVAEHADDDTEGFIRPQKALWDARQALGPHDVLLSDVGAHKMWIARHYHCHEPNTCLIPNGFCSMGFALPGAIAASMVLPDRRILAVCGDGGFLMNVQEMETARRLGVNFVALVWEDGGYGLIAWKQDNEFDRHTDLAFGNPDWLKLAESFGWNGHRVDNSRDLRDTLEAAFNEPGPSLVVMPVDYRENQVLTRKLGLMTCKG
ncbi:MAG: thiamine pyrophosphate-dependent enzyme [Gammaproteobacteria bacterium]